ncbi:hypothetical protein JMG10_27225 [Nostoc ellipsosporum NOK]|nr:hypothetical protein [Nostoc ellipsosporum NOK]
MGIIFYQLFLWLFGAGVRVASLFNAKAKLWVRGRRDLLQQIRESCAGYSGPGTIWMHCASLGEFEQGRPVLEQLRLTHPGHRLILTFFSPSGYEVRKNYAGADFVFYLPSDSPAHARALLDSIRPSLVIFVKYEFWYYYLSEVAKRGIPLLLISAIFRPGQPFFQWWGGLHRRMLHSFTHLFVQDSASADLLKNIIPADRISIAGDTRFDRVAAIAADAAPVPVVNSFCGNSPVLVAGSTWPEDEQHLRAALQQHPHLKYVIAPHEIGAAHLEQVMQLFPGAARYSIAEKEGIPAGARVLVIDNIGMLSRLYQYGRYAYVGGGFGKGIHNILEAAVYGIPVFYGPAFEKFREARELRDTGAGIPFNNGAELSAQLDLLENNNVRYAELCEKAGAYVRENKGATGMILSFIQANRLLTN